MTIISISLNDKLIEDIDKLQEDLGFSGRSEILRTAIRNLIAEEKNRSKLDGNLEGVIVIINLEKYGESISKITHKFEKIIKTQIHNHLESHKCLQLFLIKGDAKLIKLMIKELETSKKTEYIKLLLS
ncbi:CopG family ribbon-helix-helix protein [archaeon]|jgi:CopG family transcriptional regulator, nickel-responsive regulator|nr:CopG family ribbon-helix-helix protein [archaeon]MBT4648688.1 CopG family ribbon-helix-helix protein [archaeon]MBT6821812.1 CopG family ribbon-helix-helix protein [archaeon]MBT7393086.1 CopG family ribbon-helix-helix protein [archaeon]